MDFCRWAIVRGRPGGSRACVGSQSKRDHAARRKGDDRALSVLVGLCATRHPDLLHTLIDSDALYLSPFWLFQASEAEAGVVSDILLKIVSAEPDAWGLSPVTAFRTNPDGDAAEFCSRRFSPSQIDEFLAAQAARNGWRFATAPRDSARPVKGR